MANRYFVMGQVFIANGTTTVDKLGRFTTDQTITCAGAGNFTIFMTQGMAGTVTSGTATITGSVVTLTAGLNTLTAGGAGTCTLDVTIGSAANWNHVNSWSAASGGTAGASVPTSSDNVYFDVNSFTAGSQTVTVDATSYCLTMNWTGATNTPTFAGSGLLLFYGSITFIADMIQTYNNYLYFNGTGDATLTAAGTLACHIKVDTLVSLTFLDTINIGAQRLWLIRGTLDTNGQTVTCGSFATESASAKTYTLGNSTINCTSWDITVGGGAVTLTANTATIKVTGTGVFAGGSLTTYNNVELNGTAHTISGSNTFASLTFKADTTQTITFTDGTTQTITTPVITGSVGKVKTLIGSSTAGWTITKAGGSYYDADYLALSYSTGYPADTWYAGSHSTDTIGNSGWIFRASGWFQFLGSKHRRGLKNFP